MKFCSSCGSLNQKTFIDGNNRYNCTVCGTIHYENPKPTTSMICVKNDCILLGRRAFNPAKGKWGLIGGFMELNENLYDSARRELMEETNLMGEPIKIIDTYSHFNSLFGDILIIGIEMKINDWSTLKAGDDVSEAKFFKLNKLPNLAFDSHKKIIESYLQDKLL